MKDALTHSLPKLESLLADPTIFILGAGSTVDYGFPLWSELRGIFLDRLQDRSNPLFADHPGAIFWKEQLEADTKLTIDAIAENAPNEGLELFQLLTLNIFHKLEIDDENNKTAGWIELFAKKYCDLLTKNTYSRNNLHTLFRNIHFCSLNYERCFPKRFNALVEQKIDELYPNDVKKAHVIEGALFGFCEFHQPHGSLGGLRNSGKKYSMRIDASHHYNGNNNPELRYGATDITPGSLNSRRNSILPVELLSWGGTNKTYLTVNNILKNIKNVIIIGVSAQCINSSHLEFTKNSIIYYNGSEFDDGRFICLDAKAAEIAELL